MLLTSIQEVLEKVVIRQWYLPYLNVVVRCVVHEVLDKVRSSVSVTYLNTGGIRQGELM